MKAPANAQVPLKSLLRVRTSSKHHQSGNKDRTITNATAAHIKKAAGCVEYRTTACTKAPQALTQTRIDQGVENKKSGQTTAKAVGAVCRSVTPEKRTVTGSPQRTRQQKGEGEGDRGAGTARKRKFVHDDDSDGREDDTATALLGPRSSNGVKARRRLWAHDGAPGGEAGGGTKDPIATALNASAGNVLRSSKREKYAHLLAGPKHAAAVTERAPTAEGATSSKERFRYLLDKDDTSLRLPFKYQILLAKFLALETVCMIQGHCRGKTVTYDSARPGVERTCSKAFTLDDLAMIMTVYPEAYDLALIHRHGMSPQGLRGTIGGYHNGSTTIRISVDFGSDLEVDECMDTRKKIFSRHLQEITVAAHKDFLHELNPGLEVNGSEFPTQWHPSFKLDAVPDIAKADLPKLDDSQQAPTAAEILSGTSTMSTTVKRALEHVVAKQSIPPSPVKKRRLESPTKPGSSPKKSTESAKPLSLLERIRLKERLSKEQKAREEEAAKNGGSKYKKMWECALIMRSCALTRRRTALPIRESIVAVKRNMKQPMSEVAIQENLTGLAATVPQWCEIKKVQNKRYFAMVPSQFADAQKFFESHIVN